MIWGNVLEFPRMLKDSYVWLQITQENQMPVVSEFPLNPLLLGIWISFEIGGYLDKLKKITFVIN